MKGCLRSSLGERPTRSRVGLEPAQCREAGELLGRIHLGPAEAFPEGVGPIRCTVPAPATVKTDIDPYQVLTCGDPVSRSDGTYARRHGRCL
jgi:hypothetical protein